MNLAESIRNIPDFPSPGIQFKDISTLLKDAAAFKEMVDAIKDSLDGYEIDLIVGPEARGFLFGAPLAYAMNKGFVLARKPGKLPYKTIKYQYELEYGMDALEIHEDSVKPGTKVAIIDDLLATGGTSSALVKLIEKAGAEVVAIRFAIELLELNGRAMLSDYDVGTIVAFEK